MRAFLTGSRIYSVPKKDSDIDLVVLMSEWEILLLKGLNQPKKSFIEKCRELISPKDETIYNTVSPTTSLRFGPLNLLCVSSEKAYNDWREGTDQLRAKAPVSREEAVRVFTELFARSEDMDNGEFEQW